MFLNTRLRDLFAFLLLLCFTIAFATLNFILLRNGSNVQDARGSLSTSTLVLYVYSATDPEYRGNLEFFVKTGMHERDGCEYRIIVQGINSYKNLPSLPANARYIYHRNACYDWGTFGWALSNIKQVTEKYTLFIFMNSSMRGPFLPPSWPDNIHWTKAFQSKLNDKVKLVGSTISCEPTRENGDPKGRVRHVAHVQSYVMATDKIGLEVMLRERQIFECHESIAAAVFNAELGASLAIFKAGYTIDSLMLRYQGIDWTKTSNWDCNARLNPYAEFAYDGINLNPLEVMFVKVKAFQVETGWTSAEMAVIYDRWLASQGQHGAINSNRYRTSPMRYRMGRILQMQLRGKKCFDFTYYRRFSPDIPSTKIDDHLWEEFINDQQFSGRKYRFLCKSPFEEDRFVISLIKWQGRKIRDELNK